MAGDEPNSDFFPQDILFSWLLYMKGNRNKVLTFGFLYSHVLGDKFLWLRIEPHHSYTLRRLYLSTSCLQTMLLFFNICSYII